MKKGAIIGLGILALLVIWGISSQRGLVTKEESVNEAWANVNAAYQKRFDLVDNLVEIVKGEADFESQTLKEIIQARSQAFQMKVEVKDLTEENMRKLQELQGTLGAALGRIAVLKEEYPRLQTNESFKKLQDNVVEIENQIKVERRKFNEVVKTYNVAVRKFPGNIMAGILGFETRPMFGADAGAEKAPKIDFKNR